MAVIDLWTKILLASIMVSTIEFSWQIEARIYTLCEGVRELEVAGVSRTFISNWICLMQSESGMNTKLVTGPKTSSSFSFGILQINSLKWCTRGRKGGLCHKRCEDFTDNNIQDDIKCALKVLNMEGFKHWKGWLKYCKKKPTFNISKCKTR